MKTILLICLCVVAVGFIVGLAIGQQVTPLLQIETRYKGDIDQARGVRDEVRKWDYHFAAEIQKKDEAKSLAFDGANLHANTSHEALLHFTHRVHCLAWCVSNHVQAIEFTNIVERWITNIPTGPE